MKKNNICYVQIPAPDIKAAGKFYTKVFGWKITAKFNPTYWQFDDGHVGGGFDADMKPAKTGVILVLQVADIPKSLTAITKAGGRVTKDKTPISGGKMGDYAYFRDPHGNQLGIWSKK